MCVSHFFLFYLKNFTVTKKKEIYVPHRSTREMETKKKANRRKERKNISQMSFVFIMK